MTLPVIDCVLESGLRITLVKQVAYAPQCNRWTLEKRVTKGSGLRPSFVVDLCKGTYAAGVLVATDEPITAVAQTVGYSQGRELNRLLQRTFGITGASALWTRRGEMLDGVLRSLVENALWSV